MTRARARPVHSQLLYRHVNLLRELRRSVPAVHDWLEEHRDELQWLEQALGADAAQQQQQQRGGAHGGALAHGGGLRHGGGARGVAESVRQRAARADAMRVAADSEDESDGGGAQCDKVIVQGAGTRAANGAYRFAGECDEVGKYALEVEGCLLYTSPSPRD